MKFEFYVPNYNCNAQTVEMYNIFDNYYIQTMSEKAIKKYLRAPSKYCYTEYFSIQKLDTYGFEGLVKKIDSIMHTEMWAHSAYETSISDAFIYEICDIVREFDKYDSLDKLKEKLEKENKRNAKLEKWDCYEYCKPNMEIITHEIIRQYKEQIKNKDKFSEDMNKPN